MPEDAVKHDQKVRSLLDDPKLSAFEKYQMLTTGEASFWGFLKYDSLHWLCSCMPGAAGYFLRQKFYPALFAELGRGATIGRACSFRGVKRIKIGRNVMIEDNVVLEARGPDSELVIGDNVLIARNSVVRARGGRIVLGDETDIGTNCIVSTDSELTIGREVLIAAFAYVCAGGNHRFDDPERSIMKQGFDKQGGVTIGDGVWIGSHAMVMDGASIGAGAIIGSHAVVRDQISAMQIAVGTPARVVKSRPGA